MSISWAGREEYHSMGATVHTLVQRMCTLSVHLVSRVLAECLLPCLWRGHRSEELGTGVLR